MASNRLTWENVANPNFSGVADSYRVMSELLGKATQSGQGIIDTFTKGRSDAADKAIMQRLAAVQDPNQFDPTAIIGADAQNASMDMLGDVADRREFLLNNAAKAGTESRAQYSQGRLVDSHKRTDAAGPAAQAYFLALQSGRTGEADKILSENPALRNLNANEFASIANSGDEFTSREGSRYSQGRARREDTFQDSAASDAEILRNQGFGIDPANDEWIVNSQGWDAQRTQRALARAGAGGAGGGGAPASAAIGAVVGGGGGSASNTPEGINNFKQAMGRSESEGAGGYAATNDLGYTGKYQFGEARLQDAINSGAIPKMSMAEFKKNPEAQEAAMDWAIKDVDAYIARNGLDQYIGKTVGGVPITQDAMRGMAHIGGSAGMKRFLESDGAYNPNDSYIKKTGAGAGTRVRGTSLSDYARKFSGVNLPTRPTSNLPAALQGPEQAASNQAAAEIQNAANEGLRRQGNPSIPSLENATTRDRISASQINTLIPEYEQLLGATPDVIEAATLVADRVGGDAGKIATKIREIVAKGSTGVNRVNIAQAAAIVQASSRGGTEGADLWGLRDWATGNSFGGPGMGAGTFSFDENMADVFIKDVTSGTTRGQIQKNEDEVRAQNAVNQADAAVAGLLQSLQRAQAAKQAGRSGLDPLIKRLNEQLEEAGIRVKLSADELAELQKVIRPQSSLPTDPLAKVPAKIGEGTRWYPTIDDFRPVRIIE